MRHRVVFMGNTFESDIVHAFNAWFDEHDERGIAYRLKQAQFTEQKLDVVVDSPLNYLGIECKSIRTRSSNKMYFSQHFSETESGHQVERANRFLEDSGRSGYLAIEVRRGKGYAKQAFMIDWDDLTDLYDDEDRTGISIYELQEDEADIPFHRLTRIGGEYIIPNEIIRPGES